MKADRVDIIWRNIESGMQNIRERLFDKAEAADLYNWEERLTEYPIVLYLGLGNATHFSLTS